jgi:hypothetical protein
MSTQALRRLSADEYLRLEARSEIRHEFVHGQLFDMVGGTDTHNLIALNIASALRERLRGGPCRVFMADMKVHIAAANVFYYPDVILTCDSIDKKPYFKEHPCLIAESSSRPPRVRTGGRSFLPMSCWKASGNTLWCNRAVDRSRCSGGLPRGVPGPNPAILSMKRSSFPPWPSR